MISRSAFFKLWAQPKTPAQFFQARMSRSLMTAMVAAGLLFSGSGKLLAQDVPPPPPDAQDQQQAPQNNQQLPQYGAPLPQDQQNQAPQQAYPQDQQGSYPQQQQAPAPQGQPLTADQLSQLVAPIALYPDALVAQILAASTYPTQVVEADRWVQGHSNLKGEELAKEVDKQDWDPSVKAVAQFPSVLENMDKNLSWTSSLGETYINQPQDVTDAVQTLRQQARNAGNLNSNEQEKVTTQGSTIIIEPAYPDVVYVPAYDPWL